MALPVLEVGLRIHYLEVGVALPTMSFPSITIAELRGDNEFYSLFGEQHETTNSHPLVATPLARKSVKKALTRKYNNIQSKRRGNPSQMTKLPL